MVVLDNTTTVNTFVNLCLHYNDFKGNGKRTFFATSHDKSPCHGTGGTIQRLTTRASLQRLLDSQTLSAKTSIDSVEIKSVKSRHFFGLRMTLRLLAGT